jgi:hypothetical protein
MTGCAGVMSVNDGSDAKYERILEKLAELKALSEETDRKVGVLHAVEERRREEVLRKMQEGRLLMEKEEAERRRKEEEASRKAEEEK